jgi:hypothetical protein
MRNQLLRVPLLAVIVATLVPAPAAAHTTTTASGVTVTGGSSMLVGCEMDDSVVGRAGPFAIHSATIAYGTVAVPTVGKGVQTDVGCGGSGITFLLSRQYNAFNLDGPATVTWKAVDVLAFATATGVGVTGACFLMGQPVPFDAATASCTLAVPPAPAPAPPISFNGHAQADAGTPGTGYWTPTGLVQTSLTVSHAVHSDIIVVSI